MQFLGCSSVKSVVTGKEFSPPSPLNQKGKVYTWCFNKQSQNPHVNPHFCPVVWKKTLTLPEEQSGDYCSESYRNVFVAASVPSCAVIVVQERPVHVAHFTVIGSLAA